MNHRNKPSVVLSQSRWLPVLSLLVSMLFAGAAQAEENKSVGSSKVSAQKAAPSGVVNINTATEEELGRLPGIGPSKAQAILKLREHMGSFKRVESLLRVRGIGRKTLRKLSPMIALSGQTTMAAPKSSKRRSATK